MGDRFAALRGGSAVRTASRLLSSSLIAQVAVLGALAVVAARLTPEDMALYGVLSGVGILTGSVSTWAAEARVPVAERDDAEALLRAGSMVNDGLAAVGLLIGSGLALAGSWDWAGVALLCAWQSQSTGYQRLLFAVVLRVGRATALGRWRLVQGISNAALLLVGWGVVERVPGVWVLGGALVLSTYLGNAVLRREPDVLVPRWHLRHAPTDLKVLKREVGPQPWSNLMTGVSTPLPQLLLPALGAVTLAGSWALAGRFLTPMINTLYNTLQPLYYERAANALRQGDVSGMRHLYQRWTLGLVILAIPAAGAFGVGVGLVLPLLGPQWETGPAVTAAAVLYFGSLVVGLPLSQTLVLTGALRTQLWWTLSRVLLTTVPMLALPLVGAGPALVLWACAVAATWALQVMLAGRHVRRLAAGASRPDAPVCS